MRCVCWRAGLSAEQKTITRKMVLPHDAAAFTQKEFKLRLDENFGPGAKIITFTDSDGDDCTVETMQDWRYSWRTQVS